MARNAERLGGGTCGPAWSSFAFGGFASLIMAFSGSASGQLQTPAAAAASDTAEQAEADYRVIAARCGTPAFEKLFYRQSKAAVAAGLIVAGKDPAMAEKSVEARRRSPAVLVPNRAGCDNKVAELKDVMKRRGAVRGASKR